MDVCPQPPPGTRGLRVTEDGLGLGVAGTGNVTVREGVTREVFGRSKQKEQKKSVGDE